MSFWTLVGVTIQDLNCLKASCKEHEIDYNTNEDKNFKWRGDPVEAVLRDTKSKSCWFLVRKDGALQITTDNDMTYNKLSGRVGKNGGKVTRDYTREVIKKGVSRNGGMVNSVEEQADGSVIMKIAAM